MILKAEEIAKLLEFGDPKPDDPLVITPLPDTEQLKQSGAASVDLRLGTWFLKLQQTREALLKVEEEDEASLTRLYYVPFGDEFVLHPRTFVLGVTLEWVRLPQNLAGYVIGKSSWGRRGLIIATAAGVHPGFTGCLTLELTNVGEMPIEIKPGLEICQLFLQEVKSSSKFVDRSSFLGLRRPTLGRIKMDEIASKLAKSRLT